MLPSSHIWDTMKELNLIISGFEEENKELKDCITALQRENERLREYLDKMIKGGEITETLSKGNDYYESKGALEAFKAVKALLTKEKN